MGSARRATTIFLVWTSVGLFFVTQDLGRKAYFGDPTPWWHNVVSWLVGVWISAALTPLILALGRRFPIERRVWLRRIALHLLASVGFALASLSLVSALLPRLAIHALAGKTFGQTLTLLAALGFHGSVVSYFLVLGIQQAFRTYLRASELQTQLVRAQLGALKAQLQPHFLFNTLNAIMVLVRQQRTAEAEETLGRLSDLLRGVLDDVEAQEVPLRRELDTVRLYLSIEQLRFQDRLRVEIEAEPAALDAAVPQMGLQPLVENAVRHAVGQRAGPGTITVRAARRGGLVAVEVIDDGPGLPPGGPAGHGIGLANTRARLERLYGDGARLDLANGPSGGAVATLIVPYRPARDDDDAAQHADR